MAPSALNYDPTRRYDFKVEDVEYRRDSDQSWLAMVYQPQGSGPAGFSGLPAFVTCSGPKIPNRAVSPKAPHPTSATTTHGSRTPGRPAGPNGGHRSSRWPGERAVEVM